MIFYIHTIDGCPAEFSEEHRMIFYGQFGRGRRGIKRVAYSRAQILKERALCKAERTKFGWPDRFRYGYMRFEIPDQQGDKK
jgi:hypothetical protein